MAMTYKEAWIRRVLRHLDIKGEEGMKLREDLRRMTGHGVARLSIAIEGLLVDSGI